MKYGTSLTLDEAADRYDVAWVRPSQSTGRIQPTPRTRGSVRGHLVDYTTNRALGYHSTLEQRLGTMLSADPTVIDLEDQPSPVLNYQFPGENKVHEHTFDFRATFSSGIRIAYAVKPLKKVKSSRIHEIVDLIKVQSLRGFADIAVVATEEQITQEKCDNAEEVNEARRSRVQRDCDTVLAHLRSFNGPVSMIEVADGSDDPGRTRIGILCLIYDGLVKHLDPFQRFDDAPMIVASFH